jgi:acetoin utilization deacetylase AcuC-like enzyme
MTLLYYDPVLQEHQTANHPERPERLAQVVRHLQWTGLDSCCRRPAWKPISTERLARVHSLKYAETLKTFAERGGGFIEHDTVVSPRSYEVALMAAGAVCDAVERVTGGEDRRALCLVRPPGHHALPTGAMGFCLFNNIALGARLATDELGLDRVLIVDWDVHHGNGTQEVFWEDGRVGYLSIHRSPFYPDTGGQLEIGFGPGLGTTRNVPVEFGTPRSQYLARFQRELESFADQIRPQLVLISAGFDAHREDPIGSLGLETEDFRTLTQMVLNVAATHANGSLVSVLEGGYNPYALTDCVDVHLDELLR